MTGTATVAPARPGWLRAARWMARTQLRGAVWFWAFAGVLTAATLALNAATVGVDASVAQYVGVVAPWFIVAMAILTTWRHLALHVVSGLTRRAFVGAAMVVGALVAVTYAGGAVVVLRLEGALFAVSGWPHVTGDGSAFDPGAEFTALFVPLALSFAAAHVSGLLVGLAYYRLGWWGTATLPLTLAPYLLLGGDATGRWLPSSPDLHSAAGVSAALVVLAVGVLAARLLARRTAIRAVA